MTTPRCKDQNHLYLLSLQSPIIFLHITFISPLKTFSQLSYVWSFYRPLFQTCESFHRNLQLYHCHPFVGCFTTPTRLLRPNWLAIDLDFVNNLWLPNVFIYDLKEFKVATFLVLFVDGGGGGGDMLLLFMQMVDYPLPFFFYPSFTFPSITNFSITQTIHVLHKLAALFVVKEGRSIEQKEWGPFDIFTRHWICGSVFTNILYQTAVDKRWTTQQTQTIPIINERKSSCIYKSSAQSVHGKSRVKWDYFWPHENLLGHDLNMISLEFCVFQCWRRNKFQEKSSTSSQLMSLFCVQWGTWGSKCLSFMGLIV